EKYRNYGKEVIGGKVYYPLRNGFNYRLSEFVAALGIVQLERLPVILEWKRELASKFDNIFQNRIKFPEGMVSGYYKYIVFDYKLKEETGKVFGMNDLCHIIDGTNISLPNSEWIAQHHNCVPIWYGWGGKEMDIEQIKLRLLG
ncbi:MAG TPA: DegT/DnrJ/EryC1/StrS family aminotransferase, partial [Candidatus Methanoperedens sp.]|nr:DegT/DnrJ/EryC1/StrS family aminotransferase [Candidatus Methanoperedens sp.]